MSTWGPSGANLAPFSYFGGVSARPLLVSVSIGHRRATGPKDTAVNIRKRGAFCVNVVTESHLEAMNATSVEAPPDVDEFVVAGLEAATSDRVDAPYVADCPAVLECTVHRIVDLGDVPNTLVIGEVVGVRLSPHLEMAPGTLSVDAASLRPVGRLAGSLYSLLGETPSLSRPDPVA